VLRTQPQADSRQSAEVTSATSARGGPEFSRVLQSAVRAIPRRGSKSQRRLHPDGTKKPGRADRWGMCGRCVLAG